MRCAAALGVLLAACTPELDPPWLITRPTELSVRAEVIEQGPYGDPITDGARPTHEALPLDTLRLEPFVVSADGPIPTTELEVAWILNEDPGALNPARSLEELEPCDANPLPLEESCIFANTGSATLALGDIVLDPTLPFAGTVQGPALSMIGGAAGGPSPVTCSRRLRDGSDLGECIFLARALRIGPLSDLVALAEAAGVEVELIQGLELLLSAPRNRLPVVESLEVIVEGLPSMVASAQSIQVPADATVRIEYRPSELDEERWEFELADGETQEVVELHEVRWFTDARVDTFEEGLLSVQVGLAPDTPRARVYAAVTDGRGGEAWAWVELKAL